MIPRMSIAGGEQGQSIPKPCGAHMRAHNKRPHEGGHNVSYDMLQWMRVESKDTDRSSPLVMFLMDVLVQGRMMQ